MPSIPPKHAFRGGTSEMPSASAARGVQLQYPVGLSKSLSPVAAMEAVEDLPEHARGEADIKQCLRMSAITIYTHEKLSEYFHTRAQSDDCMLPLLLCLLHGRDVSDPRHALRMTGFDKAHQLPFASWDSLYLVLVAEIRIVYHDVLRELATESGGNNKLMLHHFGIDGTEDNAPLPLMDFATQLEDIWSLLMSAALLGPLEHAVRKQRLNQQYLDHTHDENFNANFEQWWNNQVPKQQVEVLNKFKGILDPISLSPTAIFDFVRENHVPSLRQACAQHRNNRGTLSTQPPPVRRADQDHETDYFGQYASEDEPQCFCDEQCACSIVCQFAVQRCSCKAAPGQSSVSPPPRRYYEDTVYQADAGTPSPQHRNFETVSSNMAQMQIAAQQSPGHFQPVQPVHTAQIERPERPGKNRQRSNTARSDLAYVPDVVPPPPVAPFKKDAYPLAFYGRNSGQRYPNFSQPSPGCTPDSTKFNGLPPKPLASPLAAVMSSALDAGPTEESRSLAPSDSIIDDKTSPLNARNIIRRIVPAAASTSYTQSFPVPAHGSHRGPENEFSDWDTSHIKTPVLAPLGQHPGTADRAGTLRHSVDAPSPVLRAKSSIQDQVAQSEAVLPPEALPLPDFIAPRPAMQQRYVSAGGDAKLKDRPVIADFTLPPAVEPGMTFKKEDLETRLSQMSPPRRDSGLASGRPSHENVISPASSRVSRDLSGAAQNESRHRTSSSVSARIKRIFSRHGSASEGSG